MNRPTSTGFGFDGSARSGVRTRTSSGQLGMVRATGQVGQDHRVMAAVQDLE
ncbi:MAG: hypothetical protein ACTHMY_10150 [Solirubrobacteraceae bacterium]